MTVPTEPTSDVDIANRILYRESFCSKAAIVACGVATVGAIVIGGVVVWNYYDNDDGG